MSSTKLAASRSLPFPRRLVRCATAFSAFGTLADTSHAFQPPAVVIPLSYAPLSRATVAAPAGPTIPQPLAFVGSPPCVRSSPPHRQAVRALSSRRNYDYDPDEDKDKNIFSKAADAAKSLLPSNWFKSEEEKKAELARKRARDEISGGLSEVLKDAPLPVRMMGKMVGGVLSNVAAGLAESVAEQSRRMEKLMDDARGYIVADGIVADELGEPVVIGAPFSQSSSTTSINGKTTVRVQSSFEVMGSRSNGVATMVADEGGISQLSVNIGGRSYNVSTSGRPRPGSSGKRVTGSGSQRGNVIDAEIIDAEFTEKK